MGDQDRGPILRRLLPFHLPVCRCFADVKPRVFDRASCVMMNSFSELVVRQLEKDVLLKVRLRQLL